MDSPYEQPAREWLRHDPDPATRAELEEILARRDVVALADRFAGRLEFGTAGLRGELGAGPRRMNRVTVMRAAAGLARWLGSDATVIIGHDARHGSTTFALDSARVLTGAGARALVLDRMVPTPVLAFAVRDLDADAGVMVTASHNPPRDNGYKVYTGRADDTRGAQIVPPVDAEISAEIDAVGPVDELRLAEAGVPLGSTVVDDYLAALSRLPLGDARELTIAYTPLHGVGRDVALAAFDRCGFAAPAVVVEQAEPDPDFPTVAFPNPEEPGAMDLALALGRRVDADLVIANDPDADRCAVACQGRMLTGDEVGGLLAEHVLAHTSGVDRLVATTIVSSSLLGKIAAAHRVRYAETLTGFKWIARADAHHAGGRLVFGYEEALGYLVAGDEGPPVRDKDGIGAALAVAGLAAAAKRAGRSLLDLLDDQSRRYGVHATRQVSIRVGDPAEIAEAMERLRAGPPEKFGDHSIRAADDLARDPGDVPSADVLRYRLDHDVRVVIRPSGTEPKLKIYLEAVAAVTTTVDAAREQANSRLDALATAVPATLGLPA